MIAECFVAENYSDYSETLECNCSFCDHKTPYMIRRLMSTTKKNIACVDDLKEAVRRGALIVDLRTVREIATANGSVNIKWNRETESLDHKEVLNLTKNDHSVPIIVH